MNTLYLSRPGGRLAYDSQGSGPALIALPPGGELRSTYRLLKPKLLAAGYRVITLDLRGQGESSAEWDDFSAPAIGGDILTLIEHLGLESATLLANSVSCAAAIWAAAEAPRRINGLVLSGSFAQTAAPWKSKLISGLALHRLWGRAAYLRYYPSLYPLARPADYEAHLGRVADMLADPKRLAAMRRLFGEVGQEWDARIEQVRVPTLVVMGAADPDFSNPEAVAYQLAQRLQHAPTQVALLDGAGHHPQAECPELLLAHLLPFLEQIHATIAV
jgi:pimeloyl-ACP methyl ester carboxylesterase